MHSLSHILREHGPLLVLDAASSTVQVGLLGDGEPRWACRQADAGAGLFQGLEDLGVDIDSVGAFAFCAGPGSILGVRSAAAAVRAWNVLSGRPTFAYLSLEVVARALADPDLSILCDARRGLWHRYTLAGGLERVAAASLSGPTATPEGFRHWEPLPAGTRTVPYDLGRLLGIPSVLEAPLLRPAAEPDAFLHQEPAYAEWVPQIHRAP